MGGSASRAIRSSYGLPLPIDDPKRPGHDSHAAQRSSHSLELEDGRSSTAELH